MELDLKMMILLLDCPDQIDCKLQRDDIQSTINEKRIILASAISCYMNETISVFFVYVKKLRKNEYNLSSDYMKKRIYETCLLKMIDDFHCYLGL